MATRPSFSQILWRHKTSFGGIFFTGTLASFLFLQQMPVTYQSRAVLEYPPQVSLAKALNDIQSEEHLKTLIAEFDLDNDARFHIDTLQATNAVLSSAKGKFKSLNLFEAQEEISAERENAVLNVLRSNLRAIPADTAGQIEISVTASDPDLAAQLTNALAERQIQTAKAQKGSSSEIFSAVSEKIDAMQENLAVLDTKISEQQKQITTARIQSELSFENTMASITKAMDSLSINKREIENTHLPNHTVTRLETEMKALVTKKNKLSARYGAKHPKMVALSEKIITTDNAIHTEKTMIETARNSKLQAIEEELALLEVKLASVAPAAGEPDDTELKTLQSEKSFIQNTLSRLISEQTQNAKSLGLSNIVPELVLTATPDDTPVSVKPSVLMAYAACLFALLGTLPGGISEMKRRKIFLSAQDIEEETGRPCFARLELVDDFDGKPVADYILNNPQSQISEALKALRIQLKLRAPRGEKSQTIMICSALENEGKSTTALWLARQAAQAGTRTILIDADLRTPSIHKALQADNSASIADALTGRRLLDQCIRKDLKTGLHVLLGSPTPNSASDLLSNKNFAVMMTSLRNNYELIIIDTHSALPVADSRAIAPLTDQILLNVQWNRTPRELVHNSVTELSTFSTAPIALILAGIDVVEQAKLGYGDVLCTYENA